MITEDERRTYHRLKVNLLFSCWPLAAGKVMIDSSQVENLSPFKSWSTELKPTLPPTTGEQEDLNFYRQILQYVDVLERKIILLEAMLTDPQYRDFFQQQPRPVILSAAGISFPATEPLTPGALYHFSFFLPHVALLVGVKIKIMRQRKKLGNHNKNDYYYAAQFVDLPTEIEDEIARFIILTERQQLRLSRFTDGQQKKEP